MFKIQFFLGMPHANPRQQIAEALSMHDDAEKAVAEARAKASFIIGLLAQRPVEKDPHKRVPKKAPITGLEIRLTADDGQITLLSTEPKPPQHKPMFEQYRPSGDYHAWIQIKYGEQYIGLGELDFASTTATHALTLATEQARELIDQLRKEPKLKFLRFQDVHIDVERVNTQISFVGEQPDHDWRHMEYPVPRF